MKKPFFLQVEEYWYNPNINQRIISYLLLPISYIVCFLAKYKRQNAKPIEYGIDIISIGNLVVGGSGKTPLTINLANRRKDVAIILRGYGRKTKGLLIVSKNGEIKVDVKAAGDEAMLFAKYVPNSTVIVSEDRVEAILKAKELGAKIIFLDDGFSKVNIKKKEILIIPQVEPVNDFCIPSGAYREPKSFYKYADLLIKEGIDFKRKVKFYLVNHQKRTLLEKEELSNFKILILTAISKPSRLYEYLPKKFDMLSFPDHSYFDMDIIKQELKNKNATHLLVTAKDFVKIDFIISPIILMDLELELSDELEEKLLSLGIVDAK